VSAHGLANALGALGVRSRVEAREALAIVTVHEAAPAAIRALRNSVLTLGKEHGFKHVAVELDEAAEAGAPLHRD